MKIQMEKDAEVVLKILKKERRLSISDITRDIPMKKSKVRSAIAFLLGARKIVEVNFGMAKVYFLK